MPDGNKKVFISWSKPMSKRVAHVLNEYLPQVLNGVDLFMSDKNIGPGERSMKVLESQLNGTTYGLLVVTAENQGESWLNFEAGALSKQVGKDEDDIPRVVPLLVDIDNPTQLTGPVSQFQAVKLDHDGLLRTILSIATLVSPDTTVIEKRFVRTWPEMEPALAEAKRRPVNLKKPERSVESKIDEALEILRTMQRRQDVDIYRAPIGKPGGRTSAKSDDIDSVAAQYHLKRVWTGVNSENGEQRLIFRSAGRVPLENLKEFEQLVRNIAGPGTEIHYSGEAVGGELVELKEEDLHNGEDQVT